MLGLSNALVKVNLISKLAMYLTLCDFAFGIMRKGTGGVKGKQEDAVLRDGIGQLLFSFGDMFFHVNRQIGAPMDTHAVQSTPLKQLHTKQSYIL